MGDVATIVKLGGSVVTRKDRPLMVDKKTVKRLCEELARSGKKRLIVIHGGGSFGHHIVHRLRLLPPSKKVSRISLAKVVQSMDKLSSIIVDNMIESGLPGVVFPTFALVTSRSAKIRSLFLRSVIMALEMGLVPVMRGDLCCDEASGYAIVSGDRVAEALARRLSVDKVIMCIDRDGIERNGMVLPVIGMRDRSYRSLLWESKRIDVTGGMAHKLEVLRSLARKGVGLLLINGRKPGRLLSALKGRPTVGTELRW